MTLHPGALHAHQFYQSGRYDQAPVPRGLHTAFRILTCHCGATDVFPRFNYYLTTVEFRTEFLLELKTAGRFLVENNE